MNKIKKVTLTILGDWPLSSFFQIQLYVQVVVIPLLPFWCLSTWFWSIGWALFPFHSSSKDFLSKAKCLFQFLFSPFIYSFWFQVVSIFITIFVHIKNRYFSDKKCCFLLHPVSFLRGNSFQIFKLLLLIYSFLALHVVIRDTVYIVISWYFHFRHYLLTPSMKGKDLILFHHCPPLLHTHTYIYTWISHRPIASWIEDDSLCSL